MLRGHSDQCRKRASEFYGHGYATLPLVGFHLILPQGFNAINGSELAGALESDLTYYQV